MVGLCLEYFRMDGKREERGELMLQSGVRVGRCSSSRGWEKAERCSTIRVCS